MKWVLGAFLFIQSFAFGIDFARDSKICPILIAWSQETEAQVSPALVAELKDNGVELEALQIWGIDYRDTHLNTETFAVYLDTLNQTAHGKIYLALVNYIATEVSRAVGLPHLRARFAASILFPADRQDNIGLLEQMMPSLIAAKELSALSEVLAVDRIETMIKMTRKQLGGKYTAAHSLEFQLHQLDVQLKRSEESGPRPYTVWAKEVEQIDRAVVGKDKARKPVKPGPEFGQGSDVVPAYDILQIQVSQDRHDGEERTRFMLLNLASFEPELRTQLLPKLDTDITFNDELVAGAIAFSDTEARRIENNIAVFHRALGKVHSPH